MAVQMQQEPLGEHNWVPPWLYKFSRSCCGKQWGPPRAASRLTSSSLDKHSVVQEGWTCAFGFFFFFDI